ncbi:hypothetical protein [Yersinia frederiksenii]|uniref:hypothetical protein n=1 Tax=Yersinia frederiksenii TaxID=29484 RepID=UPI0011AA6C79|nr:hypothetical protein [Yersinia frederiksenii]
MFKVIMVLSDLSYQLGIIGLIEYQERFEIYRWLKDNNNSVADPRNAYGEDDASPEEGKMHNKDERDRSNRMKDSQLSHTGGRGGQTSEDEDDSMHFLAFKKWLFTVGDTDCFPSVPHAHSQRKTNPWPKLNPYTGVVYSSMKAEDVSSRLTKGEMKLLWNDSKFIEECKKQIVWYSEFSPHYPFPNARFGRYILPRW